MISRKKKADPVLNWHPNFRVVETLPDIKQVRTGFIVNFIAITLALVALGWTLVTEVEIHKVNTDIEHYNTQIDALRPTNTKDLAASAKFVTTSKPLQFATKFFSEKLSPTAVYACLLDARPSDILFDSVEIQSIVVDLGSNKRANTQSIVIEGTLHSITLHSLDEFVDKIQSSPVLKGRITGDLKDRRIDHKGDAAAGVFTFTVTLTLKPPA